jgi:D-alanyl-D-alanine-carboxypeptidase/D-alanyl-D-alanine-endopeptidase
MPMTQEKRRRTAALLLSLPLFGSFRRARAVTPVAGVGEAVAGAAAGFMADPRAVGLSVGVIQAGRTHGYHFGTVSKRHQQMANDRTIYPIASLTKTFTGTLLAQAQREGKLKLDDDIRNYLEGDYPNLAFEQQPIRIHHLVNHVSSLPRLLPDNPEASPDFHSDVPYPQRLRAIVAKSTRADFYAGLHKVKLTAPPGTRFQYSNAAAQLAGYILEQVYGNSFATLVRQHIATPLGMRDTCITPTEEQKPRLVDGYADMGTLQPYFPDQTQAAGALKSTLADMLAYARWHLAEQDPVVRLSHQPTDRVGDYTAGLNWQLLGSSTRRVLFQDGSHPGFANLLVLHPESGIAIIVLSNEIDSGTMGRLRTLANGIANALDADTLAVP